ncbi:VOC family protein [Kineococcus sp. SYSU DK003]|uniref:VOC family protein n=1 Tax=Kineococcus sp. SYSU DK003 TaxID=3383124 RepID=UPI003D7DA6FE
MTIRTEPWPTGVPSWAELSSTDPAAAAAFYGAVLGWSTDETGPGHDGTLICRVDGHAAASIGRNGPRSWTLFIATRDLDETVGRAGAAGGTVVVPAMDIGEFGRVAVVADPTGAPVGLFQQGEQPKSFWVNGPGGLNWEDLRSADPAASREFYAAVFGWRFEPLFEEYGTVTNPDAPHPVGGIGPLWGSEPGWLVYFGVEDVDAAVSAAQAAGGAVVEAAHDSDYGRMARLADPEGAQFAVFTPPAGAAQPDR